MVESDKTEESLTGIYGKAAGLAHGVWINRIRKDFGRFMNNVVADCLSGG